VTFNLIKLDIPHYSVKFIAISAKYPKIKLDGWASLEGKGLKVSYRRGTAKTEAQLPKYIPKEDIHIVDNIKPTLAMVIRDYLTNIGMNQISQR